MKKYEVVSIISYSVSTDRETNEMELTATARDYAAPANITDLNGFVDAVEGVQLYTLYRKYAAKEAAAKDAVVKKRYNKVLASISANMPISDKDAAAARYTVAGMVGFAFFSACRGKIGTAEILPTGTSALYEAAEKGLDATNKNEIDATRRAIHAAIETLISEFTVNEGDSEFSKVWRTRIKKPHIDAAISHAKYTRTGYDKRAIHTRQEKASEVAKEVIAQVLRDSFRFTEVTTTKTVKF